MLCDLCSARPATLTDSTVINNGEVVYHFCAQCYEEIRVTGHSAFEVMSRLLARKGKECPECGTTAEDFAAGFMFGCPDCYRNMRRVAESAALSTQQALVHKGKRPR